MPSSALPQLWNGFRMRHTAQAYVFEPTASSSPGAAEVLVIDRNDDSVKLTNDASAYSDGKVTNVHGILGIIKLHTSEFLIVITSKKQVAEICGTEIFMATDFRVFPIAKEASPTLLKHPVEKTLLALLKSHLYSAPFYFSYDYDLTSTMQRQAGLKEKSAPLWQRTDERFFWNRFLMERLIKSCEAGKDVSRFILPCIFGFLEVKQTKINGHEFVLGLLARRSRHRVGTRYFSRGIDKQGNVSNFNETEQFVVTNPKGETKLLSKGDGKIKMSYVQTRGSVPVFWAEINNLRYKPDLQIMDKPETAEATRKHFDDQVSRYGDNYLVNLVNQKGYEKPVKEAYERAVDKLQNPKVHYTYYDFHHECKGMKFERVMDLIDRLQTKGLKSDDYFLNDGSEIMSKQDSVVRTNCMDCLDRTNVVQGTLARWILNQQLRSVGILSADEQVETKAEFMHMYRNMWADHADVVSKAYSGTGALKTDFTRTGKRSKEGALQDGLNSVTRYVKNNFFDGSRQDAYDLFTGAWEPSKGLPRQDRRALMVRAMPWVMLFSIAMILASIALPRGSGAATLNTLGGTDTARAVDSSNSNLYFFTLWFAVLIASSQYMVSRGLDYVAWPTLNRPDDTIFYDGPGFRSGQKGRLGIVSPLNQSSANGSEKVAPSNAGRRGQAYSQK